MALTKAKQTARREHWKTNLERARARDWVESPARKCRGCERRFRISRPRAALLECGHALYCFECYSEILTRARPKCPTCQQVLIREPLTLHLFG